MTARLAFAATLLASLWALPAHAQTFGEVEERRSTSRAYFVHVLPGEATLTVSVWGTVVLPGTYQVGVGTDLGEVLSLAGGPQLVPLRQVSDTDVSREVRVRLHRVQAGGRTVLYDATLDEMVASPEAYPVLAEGDVVEVQTRETEQRRRTWRDTATVASIAASGLVALLQVVYIIAR